jgi:gamma-glutamylcyclotransferase (GGCT)/AIG2-like uncharacterized protein YtfP
MPRDSRLRLFVYGTLKRGFGNHRRLCQGLVSAEPAEIRGKLYGLPVGYPALVIPEASILALGTAEPRADVALQSQFDAQPLVPSCVANAAGGHSGWGRVEGEILIFRDPVCLRAFDRLENFLPGRRSHYQRVLARVSTRQNRVAAVAWLYVMKDPGPKAQRLRNGRWPG